ncbi:uncharacterized protein PG998_005469 [Apiospora kogelbergensis]|uniref:uncharacterized protein n=1 Tax=Apiospora kogelbergensis TaxID=1337665 RepID=UPI00312EE79F
MKYLILTLVGLLLGLGGANAGSNMTQVLSTLPDGGYFMDMGINEHGLYSITDLDGNPVPGSPFPSTRATCPPSDLRASPPMKPLSRPLISGCVAPNEWVDWDSWKTAGRRLANWCAAGNMVPQRKILKWVVNGSEAYICNYAGDQNCDGNEYWNYMQTIADKCTFVGCGWFLQGSGNKSLGRGIKGGKSDPFYVCNNV